MGVLKSILLISLGLSAAASARAGYDILSSDEKARKGEEACCSEAKCDHDAMERHANTSGSKSGKGVTGHGEDPCFPAQIAAYGATALYAGAVSYTLQAATCTVACFAANAGPAGAGFQTACTVYGYASGALDALLTYAITRDGQKAVDTLKTGLTSLGVSIVTDTLMSSSSKTVTAAAETGSKAGGATEKKGLDAASCIKAITAAGLAATKYISAASSSKESARQYAMKFDMLNTGTARLEVAHLSADAAGNQGSAAATGPPGTAIVAAKSGAPTAVASAVRPSQDLSPATAVIDSGLSDFFQKSTGVGADNLMSSFASGVTPSQAIAALAGGTVGPDSLKLLALGEQLGEAARLTPEESSKLEPSNAPKIPAFAYEAASRGAAASGGDGMGDLAGMMAGIMEGLNPGQPGSAGARGPAAASAVGFGAKGSDKLVGVHYFPPGDDTTLFDLMNRSYARLMPRLLGGGSSVGMGAGVATSPERSGGRESAAGSGAMPSNPYLRGGH